MMLYQYDFSQVKTGVDIDTNRDNLLLSKQLYPSVEGMLQRIIFVKICNFTVDINLLDKKLILQQGKF